MKKWMQPLFCSGTAEKRLHYCKRAAAATGFYWGGAAALRSGCELWGVAIVRDRISNYQKKQHAGRDSGSCYNLL
jgi:hypothetical protein